MTRQASFTLYAGPSRYDGAPILVTLALRSRNRKTGQMAQVYILPLDSSPVAAVASGRDASVCGRCAFRPSREGGCYVAVAQAPQASWHAAHRRGAVQLEAGLAALTASDLPVRLGAYGDPAACPPALVAAIVEAAGGRATGYTHGHAWGGMPFVAHLRDTCLLSVETEAQALSARAAGWRTFRVASDTYALRGETACPSEHVPCSRCLRCGPARPDTPSVVILAHGSAKRRALTVVQ